MKFLIVGDLHGNMPKLHFKGFDAIIAPGDFCSDATRPFMFQAMRESTKEKPVKWYDLLGRKEAKVMIKQSLADGRKILERLNEVGVPVYAVPGNWDWVGRDLDWSYLAKDYFPTLTKGLKNIVNVYHKSVDIGDYVILGHGVSSEPEYPQHKEVLEQTSAEELAKLKKSYVSTSKKLVSLFKKATKPVIFMSHNVPFNTKIDMITNKESPKYGYHFGSLIAREMIDQFQPLVCIGGHMHEHFTSCKVGKTVAINAGFGSDVNVWLELEGNNIKDLQFVKK